MLTRRSLLAGLAAQTARRPMNVLFLVADDLNPSLGCYGNPTVKTPHLDRLARQGVQFDSAYCQYPLCQPSRTSFLSGRRPETTRVWTLQTPTRQYLGDAVMLPEHFRRNGYYTAHAGKIFHTGEHAEDPRSWDEEIREFGKNPKRDQVIDGGRSAGPKGHSFDWGILKTRDEETPDGIVAGRAVEFMEKAVRSGRPFFLGAGFRRPHAPYAAPQKYFDLYPLDRMPLPQTPPSHLAKLLPAAINHDPPEKPLSDEETRRYLAAYYACASFVDAQVGTLLGGLDRLKLWDNTVVVFFGDHGYHLGDHGGLWHKNTLFDQGLRVPLLLCAPGKKANGKRTTRLVELVDLYPTLVELCGLPAVEGLEGVSAVPLLDDPKRAWKKAAYSMQGRGKERSEAARDIAFLGRSVRTERWRYTEWDGGKQGRELYDHSNDPGELENVAGRPEHTAVERELHGLLTRQQTAGSPPPAI